LKTNPRNETDPMLEMVPTERSEGAAPCLRGHLDPAGSYPKLFRQRAICFFISVVPGAPVRRRRAIA